jgi:hypothetical protein
MSEDIAKAKLLYEEYEYVCKCFFGGNHEALARAFTAHGYWPLHEYVIPLALYIDSAKDDVAVFIIDQMQRIAEIMHGKSLVEHKKLVLTLTDVRLDYFSHN